MHLFHYLLSSSLGTFEQIRKRQLVMDHKDLSKLNPPLSVCAPNLATMDYNPIGSTHIHCLVLRTLQ